MWKLFFNARRRADDVSKCYYNIHYTLFNTVSRCVYVRNIFECVICEWDVGILKPNNCQWHSYTWIWTTHSTTHTHTQYNIVLPFHMHTEQTKDEKSIFFFIFSSWIFRVFRVRIECTCTLCCLRARCLCCVYFPVW